MDAIKGIDPRLSSSPCRPRIADCTQLKAVGFADNDWRARLAPEHAWHTFSTKDVVHRGGANVVRALRWLFDVVDLAPATNHIGQEESDILFEKMDAAKQERRAFVHACCRLSFAECPGDTPWIMRVDDAHEWRGVHIDEVVERCSDLDVPFKALMHGDTAMLAPPARPAVECANALKDQLNTRVAVAPRAGQRPAIVNCAQIKCGPSGWQARWGPGHEWHAFDAKQVVDRCVGTHATADAYRSMLTHHAVINVGPPVRESDERAHEDAVAELLLVDQEFDDHCNAASQLRFITPLHDDDPGWRVGGRDGWRAVRTIDVVERCGANLVAPREALSHGIAALPAAHETDALPDEHLYALAAELEAERLATILHSSALRPAYSSWIRAGDRVEVAQTAKGFEGARFVARVMAAPHGGCMDVEYEAFQEDASERRLREQVLSSRVRPLPPRAPDEWLVNASAGLQVDVHFEEGWWPASVQQLSGLCDVEPHAEVHCHNFGLSRRFTLSSLRPRWYFNSCAFRWEMHAGGDTHFRVAAVGALSSTSANGERVSVQLRPLCEDDVFPRALRARNVNPKLRIEKLRPWDTLQKVTKRCQRHWKQHVGPSTITFFMDPSRTPIESLDLTIERLYAMESMKAFAVNLFYSVDGRSLASAHEDGAPTVGASDRKRKVVASAEGSFIAETSSSAPPVKRVREAGEAVEEARVVVEEAAEAMPAPMCTAPAPPDDGAETAALPIEMPPAFEVNVHLGETDSVAGLMRTNKPSDIMGVDDGGACVAYALTVLCDLPDKQAAIIALDNQRELRESTLRADQRQDGFLGVKGSMWHIELVKMAVEANGFSFVKTSIAKLVEDGYFKDGKFAENCLVLVNGIANDRFHMQQRQPRMSYFCSDGPDDTPQKNPTNWQHCVAICGGKIWDETNPPVSSKWLWLGDDGKPIPGKKGFFHRVEKMYILANCNVRQKNQRSRAHTM